MIRIQRRAVGKLGAIILAVLVIVVATTAVLGVYAASHNVSIIKNEIAVAQSGTRIIDDTSFAKWTTLEIDVSVSGIE